MILFMMCRECLLYGIRGIFNIIHGISIPPKEAFVELFGVAFKTRILRQNDGVTT